MTLDEAISYYEGNKEVQLVIWLKELKAYRRQFQLDVGDDKKRPSCMHNWSVKRNFPTKEEPMWRQCFGCRSIEIFVPEVGNWVPEDKSPIKLDKEM